MQFTKTQFRQIKKDLIETNPDARFSMTLEAPGMQTVQVPSLDLPKNLPEGDVRITVTATGKNAKEPVNVFTGTLNMPAAQTDAITLPEVPGQSPIVPVKQLVNEFRELEEYKYEQRRKADQELETARFTTLKDYFEFREKNYQEWIARLENEKSSLKDQAEREKRLELEWQEKLHQQQLELERIKLGQPAPALTPEAQNALVQTGISFFSAITNLSLAFAAQKFGLKTEPPQGDSGAVPPPQGG